MTGCKKDDKPTKPTNPPATTAPSHNKTTEPTIPPATNPTKPTQPTVPPTQPTNPTGPTLPPCDHEPGNWIVEKASTCTTEGSRHKICSLCQQKVEEEVIPTVDHVPGSWIVDKRATCSTEGVQHQECTQCKVRIITITMAKPAHKESTIRGYSATSSRPGLTDGKKCYVCGQTTLPQYIIPEPNAQFGYIVNSDNKSCTVIALGSGSEFSIPTAISGYTVTAIGENAFQNQTSVTRVILPYAVAEIGSKAFAGCTNLTDITFYGTTAQWNAVTKGADWDLNTGNYSIHCTNGTIVKSK